MQKMRKTHHICNRR